MLSGFTAGLGYAYRIQRSQNPPTVVRLAIDLEQIKQRPLRLHLGTELEFLANETTAFFLRIGMSDIFVENRAPQNPTSEPPGANSKLTAGFGISWGSLALDVAFINESFDSSSLLSLSIKPGRR
jgi:hypothetical protein